MRGTVTGTTGSASNVEGGGSVLLAWPGWQAVLTTGSWELQGESANGGSLWV